MGESLFHHIESIARVLGALNKIRVDQNLTSLNNYAVYEMEIYDWTKIHMTTYMMLSATFHVEMSLHTVKLQGLRAIHVGRELLDMRYMSIRGKA
jgi:hypothetical protein